MVEDHFLTLFKGKRVMITGHTGFKGSWLAFLLGEIGAKVLGYALPPETKSHFNLLKLDQSIEHVEGDIRNAAKLSETMKKFSPEFVFHMAAQALVRSSYEDPKDTFEVNVIGSINLLEAVRSTPSVRSLVFITSDKCYENVEWAWGYREDDRLGGRDPYSASKAAAEIAFSTYARSFFEKVKQLGAATARAGNVIGGGDWAADRLIPDCIRSIEMDRPIIVRNPVATRPWQHVLEPLSGYMLLASKLYENPKKFSGSSWNFGPSSMETRTVLEVSEHMIAHFGKGQVICEDDHGQYHEAQLLQLNCDKAHWHLKWHPRWHIEKTLTTTAEWYKQVLEGKKAEDITRKQLYNFFPELNK